MLHIQGRAMDLIIPGAPFFSPQKFLSAPNKFLGNQLCNHITGAFTLAAKKIFASFTSRKGILDRGGDRILSGVGHPLYPPLAAFAIWEDENTRRMRCTNDPTVIRAKIYYYYIMSIGSEVRRLVG